MRSPRILTDAEKESINRLRKEGKDKKEIAKEISCGTQVIIKYLAEIGDMNKKTGRKKMPISQKIKKDKRIQSKILKLFIWGYSTDKIAKKVGIELCEVEEVTKELHLFERINKDLTCKSPAENEIFVSKLIDEIKSSNNRYPYLKYRILKSNAKILFNQLLKDRNGNEITKFDIIIPSVKAIIINTETEEDKNNWINRVGDRHAYGALCNFFSHINSPRVYFVNEGIGSILPHLEDYVKACMDSEYKFGHRFGLSDEFIG